MSTALDLLKNKLQNKNSTLPNKLPTGNNSLDMYNDTVLEADIIFDITASMNPYINLVKQNIKQIGVELLESGVGIEGCILGAGEHNHYENDHIPPEQRWGDFGQQNMPARTVLELEKQIRDIVVYETGNGTNDEAYECMANSMVSRMSLNPRKKHAIIFFGDSYPHCIDGGQRCPYGRSNEQIEFMVQMSAASYFIGCDPYRIFETRTYGIVRHSSKAFYVSFKDAAEEDI